MPFDLGGEGGGGGGQSVIGESGAAFVCMSQRAAAEWVRGGEGER